MASETALFMEMFEYHSLPDRPVEPTETVVFGRHDALLGSAMLELYLDGTADHFVVSGNFGKDSRELWKQRLPESRFVANAFFEKASNYGLTVDPGIVDFDPYKPLTGDDNARNSVRVLQEQNRNVKRLNAVSHATQTRRLASTLEIETENLGVRSPRIYRTPTRYAFNPEDPRDQKEAAAEMVRLARWPDNGWLKQQADPLPAHLVKFAEKIVPEVPQRPSEFSKFILRHIPLELRRLAMKAPNE